MADLYAAKGYGASEVGFGARLGILVVDFQKGFTDPGCVRASVVDAFQHGFRAMLVEDCCGDQELQPHLDTLRDVGRRYADIVTADAVIRRAMANSSQP